MLVLGIGNILLQDEGIGIHLLKFMEKHFPVFPDVTYLDGGTLSFTLAGEIESHEHLLVLDAVELHARPGTLCCYENEAMDKFLGTAKRSAHEVGLLDLMDIARLSGHLPKHRALIGMQYHRFAWGETLTRAVKNNLPLAGRLAANLLLKWEVAEYPPCYPRSKPKLEITR
ncbi:MAG TPA: HyaD/HybD family hydrogenase maturation endopeptidase [Candidatus Thiothrix moscowensis]|uniref:HyaD/HybD family hydrogenase maturation endopeptidase n=1 Tax=unclassified Thiothrix TaxID=2636184 RepID=UPI0025D6BDB2|nr:MULTISPECIES: HyaD/HybD family hydrogenase maturation endopeptidase [unclassified Thiothrix]HRJ53296.1 HyaD/HybD family hydrogenase maturation endopeptidase [Candidatus Thiothrix moscowensis]HRJ94135.1 HyaD/HybD family hydrogenase maturation endopeptidase [Candidatus Thiothrix moscowensis]